MKGFSIVGIGTDVGKTVVSAIVCEGLSGCYFKPIQAGDLDNSDRIKIERWCSNSIETIPEVYKLQKPMAPHAAAALENIEIDLGKIEIPNTTKPLILEGAGGVLVPLNVKGETIADIHLKSGLPVIIVSRNYLGSINHTMLTIEALKSRGLIIEGIIYTDTPSPHTEQIIEKLTAVKKIANIPLNEDVNAEFIRRQAKLIREYL